MNEDILQNLPIAGCKKLLQKNLLCVLSAIDGTSKKRKGRNIGILIEQTFGVT